MQLQSANNINSNNSFTAALIGRQERQLAGKNLASAIRKCSLGQPTGNLA